MTGRCSNRLNYSPRLGFGGLVRVASATSKVSAVALPSVNQVCPVWSLRWCVNSGLNDAVPGASAVRPASRHKKARLAAGSWLPGAATNSGAEASGLDQAHLVATGREFTTLIALNDHATTRFHTDHPGTNPAKSGGFENLDNIAGL